jgi:hypothetical protein
MGAVLISFHRGDLIVIAPKAQYELTFHESLEFNFENK